MGVYTGTDNRLVTHWMNRGPGKRADGGYFETPGISFITLNDEARICRQFDLFDLAHQMKLCDQLEDAGLLSPEVARAQGAVGAADERETGSPAGPQSLTGRGTVPDQPAARHRTSAAPSKRITSSSR
jgi:hypothetical protein